MQIPSQAFVKRIKWHLLKLYGVFSPSKAKNNPKDKMISVTHLKHMADHKIDAPFLKTLKEH